MQHCANAISKALSGTAFRNASEKPRMLGEIGACTKCFIILHAPIWHASIWHAGCCTISEEPGKVFPLQKQVRKIRRAGLDLINRGYLDIFLIGLYTIFRMRQNTVPTDSPRNEGALLCASRSNKAGSKGILNIVFGLPSFYLPF